jgi:hypothetical protein
MKSHMRALPKFILLTLGALTLTCGLLFASFVFSTPRDFSSPQATIRLVDKEGSPLSGIEVGRHWYDSDLGSSDGDIVRTDVQGIAQFSKIPANVGIFTGSARKAFGWLGPCGGFSCGTSTTIYVRYNGLCEVFPKDRSMHDAGWFAHSPRYQDSEGVLFYSGTDSQSNTMANLEFPKNAKSIDYVLQSTEFQKK